MTSSTQNALWEVAALCLRLGFTAFGGPAAHISMLYDEVVTHRGWMTEQHFLDLIGATNLIPGPNSTEMVMHVGFERARWPGLIVAGACFILPAAFIVTVLAWAYVQYGSTPSGEGLLYAVKPVILVVVFSALLKLARVAVKGPLLAVLGVAVFALYLLGINELVLLFGTAVLMLLLEAGRRQFTAALLPLSLPLTLNALQTAEVPITLWRIFAIFLKTGAVLYGSGYVLLAFLRNDLVIRLGWITDQQLLDAIAIGQVTPGPVFTTATFIGYLLEGIPGAAVATLGIFLPAFIFVGLLNPVVPRLRKSPWLAALLDGVNVASLGLMAGVTLILGRTAVVDALTVFIALVTGVLLFRFRINTTWLVLGAAGIGLLLSASGVTLPVPWPALFG